MIMIYDNFLQLKKYIKELFAMRYPNIVGAKPNFLIIGAAKAGTTSMSFLLRQHPQIFIPPKKELHYFDFDNNFGINHLFDYYSHFKNNKAVGEATPSYLYVKEAPSRIFHTLGKNVKFIISLRNPIDRAFSHYCHAVNNWGEKKYRARGYPIETLSFEDAINRENERLSSSSFHVRHFSYFNKGLYVEQLARYFSIYPKSNFYIYIFEDFANDPKKILAEICKFLNIEPSYKFKNIHSIYNKQTNKVLHDCTRKMLFKRYVNSISQLEYLLNRDLSIWKETY